MTTEFSPSKAEIPASTEDSASQTPVIEGNFGLAGKFARHRVKAGIGEKMDDALPPGSAGIIAIYERDGADAVAGALTNAIRTSTAQIDKASAAELKAGLKEASAGLAG